LLHLVGYLYYWQMGFNSVFKGLRSVLQAGRTWVRFAIESLEFFIDLILPATLWP